MELPEDLDQIFRVDEVECAQYVKEDHGGDLLFLAVPLNIVLRSGSTFAKYAQPVGKKLFEEFA
ncbi:hypothetical protein PG985_005638 [Apiospora marii]|uniref:uncharacterized protein n=1 Tax=Apiospora marii TaxID=335849 RepID=UPI003130E685